MTVTAQDLLRLGLPEGPDFAAALSEANRLCLSGAALETFVRALGPAPTSGPGALPRRPGASDVIFQREEG